MATIAHISTSTLIDLSSIHDAISSVFKTLPLLHRNNLSLQASLPLPSLLNDIPPSPQLPHLLPFPIFHLTSNYPLIQSFIPPHLSLLAPIYEQEFQSSSEIPSSSLALSSCQTLFNLISHIFKTSATTQELVIIHPDSNTFSLPTLPFPVHLCPVSQVSLVDNVPYYWSSTQDKRRPINLASVELSRADLLRLSSTTLSAIKFLSQSGKLIADLRLALLCEDPYLLQVLRTFPEYCSVSSTISHTLYKHITPVIPTDYFSLPVAQFSNGECFLLRPRSYSPPDVSSVIFTDARMAVDRAAGLDPKHWIVQSFPTPLANKSTQIGILISFDGQFSGVSVCPSQLHSLPLHDGTAVSTSFVSIMPSEVQHTRLVTDSTNEIPPIAIIELLAEYGFATIVQNSQLERNPVTQFVDSAEKHLQVKTVSIVDNPQQNLNSNYLLHTEAHDESHPPRFVAITRNEEQSRAMQPFRLAFAKISNVVKHMDLYMLHTLRTTAVKWSTGSKSESNGHQEVFAPVLMSSSRARMNDDCMSTDHLPTAKRKQFHEAYEKLIELLEEESKRNEMFIFAPHTILLDNHTFVHTCIPVGGSSSSMRKVTFDLNQRPEIYKVLSSAHQHPLFKDYLSNIDSGLIGGKVARGDTLKLEKWPLVHKRKFAVSMENVFKDVFFSKGGMYWSPSSGSTAPKQAIRVALPTALSETHLLRTRLREIYIDKGALDSDTVCVSLLVHANLSRAMEVQYEVVTGVGATFLPIGPKVSHDQVCGIIDRYGANMVVGIGSNIIELAIYCHRTGRRLDTVKSLIHGGEYFDESVVSSFSKVFNKDVKCFTVYGSSETAIISMKGPEEDCYECMSDSVHIEIVDNKGEPVPIGQVGTIVVTNMIRKIHPQIRFFTGDLGRFTSLDRTKFQTLGRDPESVRHQFGPKIITWKDITNAIGQLLHENFHGLYTYQIWKEEGTCEEMKTVVTLALYTGVTTEKTQNTFRNAAIARLGDIFTPETNVSKIYVDFLDKSEDLEHLDSSGKVVFFVEKS